MRSLALRVGVALALGLLIAASFAAVAGWPLRDTLETIAISAVSALVAALVGGLALRRFRGRSTRVQALVVALAAVLVVTAGILVAAWAMFISAHDLSALLVVVSVSAAVAVGAAVQLGDDVGEGRRTLGDLTERLVDGELVDAASVTGPGEMRQLADQLADVSRRLAESRRREQALESSRRELITWVSHDLRSPLATIRAMAEALDDGVVSDPDTVSRYHAQLRSDSERLTVLVDDLFELSRISSGALQLDRRPVRLTEVVGDALAAAHTNADLKGVTLTAEVDGLPEMLVASQELTRVLHNLLDNAIRHTPAAGEVRVLGTTSASEARIEVHDQCGGIPEPDLDRVFDVAFRSDAARSRDARGGGLGLAIAKGLVEAHAGTIQVDNEGGGCRFVVRLPR